MKKYIENGVRYYEGDGWKYPSVTSILARRKNENLERWLRVPGNLQVRARSASLGSMAHFRIEDYFARTYKLPPAELEDIDTSFINDRFNADLDVIMSYFDDFVRVHELKPLLLEAVLVNHEYHFCGTVDYVGWCDGVFVMIDWKSGRGWYPLKFAGQLASYSRCPIPGYSGPPPQGYVGQFNAGLDGHRFEKMDMEAGWREFQECLAMEG